MEIKEITGTKSKTERLQEILTLMKKLRDLGFVKGLSGMKEFSKETNKFVKNGLFYKGCINFVENPNLVLHLTLNPNSNESCSVEFSNK